MTVTVLDSRALNRALLARQHLLDRADLPALAMVDHLVAIQAQDPEEPFVGLWSRLARFAAADLDALLTGRQVVRTHLMRRTMHLVAGPDGLALRPLHQKMLVQRTWGVLRARLPGVDGDELAAAAAPYLGVDEPRRLVDVARLVADRWPDIAVRDLADALSCVLATVQIPPRGTWGHPTTSAYVESLEAWLGGPMSAPDPDVLDGMVLRYLRTFGPAASADVRAWCGLAGLPAAVARLRPGLRTFRDRRGRELLDVPDGPLPDPDTPVPPRFLPTFDNVVLGFDDRSRIIDAEHRGLSVQGARFVLVDGRVAATWLGTHRADAPVTVAVAPLRPFTAAERTGVEEEGTRLATFLGDGAPGAVSWA